MQPWDFWGILPLLMKSYLLALTFLAPLQVLEAAHAQAPQAPAAPPAPREQEDALKYLRAAHAAFKPYAQTVKPTPDEARGIIEANAPVFALLERAVELPLRHGEREPDLEPRPGVAGGEPFFLQGFTRQAARLLMLRSGVQAQGGDLDGALGSALLIVALGSKLQQDGPLMSSLTCYAVEALGLQSLQRLALKLSPEQLKTGARRLLELEAARPSLSQVLAGERKEQLRSMGAMLAQGHGPETGFGAQRQKAAMDVAREEFEVEDELLARPFPLLRGLDFEAPADDDRNGIADEPEDGEPEAAPAPRRFDARTWAQAMLKITRPTKGRALFNRARAQARLSLLATALASRAYKIEREEWPATLQVLVPGFLPSLPLDPFELDTPLQFKSDAQGVRIYSIGPDGFDDDGLAIEGRTPEINSSGDIPAPPELLKP